PEMDVERWRDAQRALEPAHVPVGLRGCGDRGRSERSVEPDGGDLCQACQRGADAEDDREQPDTLGRVCGPQTGADNVVFASPATGELAVLLAPEDAEVRADE